MAEVSAPPLPADLATGIVSAPTTVAAPVPVQGGAPIAPPAVPETPEQKSETLYIQNLNEKIKIDGLALLSSESHEI